MNGTASTVNVGQFGEFAGAVVGQLWPAIKDVSPARLQHLIENQGELKEMLLWMFSKDDDPSSLYPIAVDYGMRVEEAIELGKYDWVNKSITQGHFPTEGKGKAKLKMELVHFERYTPVPYKKATEELDRMGYRPAELMELLAFGEKYPDVQREFPIVALASVWRDSDGNRLVPYLYGGDGSRRILSLDWIEFGWYKPCRFAAVRK